ncbi:MAG: tRNA 2-thiouridine(34) synthase MnmA [Bacteroidia bacterium]|nr:tRNA 2-thiouridine(34) synthase MnmA [Bacteroidia bacterium]MDW8303133.1 tRNA 2-thiouridine(34) synthase MnmA [Bacteroidia bacterium]
MSRNGRVLVAMSGGVDSSVAAAMLHEEGYEVIGMTMKTWDYVSSGSRSKETGCCSLDSINDARNVAVSMGFPHYVIDIRQEFGDYVINHFVEEYLAGRTPNPCVLCNTHIKWEALLKRADKLDCEYIATGHYAQRAVSGTRYYIKKGVDAHKDQSYVLWGLSQKSLARTLFPIGKYHKSEIKKMALEMGFKDLFKKSESYEICFVPDNDYREFLKFKVPGLAEKVEGGNFVLTDGTVVGKHKGYPFYTIGQRRGLEIALGYPVYVVDIIPQTNTVVLGKDEALLSTEMWVKEINLMKYESISQGMSAHTKIRYRDEGTDSCLYMEHGQVKVVFNEPVRAVTPGQSAVFYENEDLIGGGWITKNAPSVESSQVS